MRPSFVGRKTDQNHTAVVRALRAVGASVSSTAAVGGGFPDLVVGFRGVNYALEVKDGSRIPSRRKLNALEQKFHDSWRGTVHVVESPEDALRVIGATLRSRVEANAARVD